MRHTVKFGPVKQQPQKPLMVGYWYSDYEPHLPTPQSGVWDEEVKAQVLQRLKEGEVLHRYRGSSSCRICGMRNGSTCLTDGKWQWPVGLAHYIEEHDVMIPEIFWNPPQTIEEKVCKDIMKSIDDEIMANLSIIHDDNK